MVALWVWMLFYGLYGVVGLFSMVSQSGPGVDPQLAAANLHFGLAVGVIGAVTLVGAFTKPVEFRVLVLAYSLLLLVTGAGWHSYVLLNQLEPVVPGLPLLIIDLVGGISGLWILTRTKVRAIG